MEARLTQDEIDKLSIKSKEKAIELMQNLAKQASGYLVPRLVKEIPDEASKTRIF